MKEFATNNIISMLYNFSIYYIEENINEIEVGAEIKDHKTPKVIKI